MKDTSTLIIVIAIAALAIAAVAFDMVMVYRKKKSREERDAVVSVMTNYQHITLTKSLAVLAVGRLAKAEMANIVYEIYEDDHDPEAFFFIMRSKDDPPVLEPADRFITVANSENYRNVSQALLLRNVRSAKKSEQ